MDVMDEGFIDLQAVHGEMFEPAEGGVAGTEIVDRQPDTERLEGIEGIGDARQIAGQQTFGDLELQIGRLHSGLLEDTAGDFHQRGIEQLPGRQIHRHPQPGESILAPLHRLGTDGANHVPSKFRDQTGLFGNGEKLVRPQQSFFGMTPAQQRLYGGDGALVQIVDGLIVDLHLPPLVYVTQSPFQIETCQCLTVHLRRIELDVSSPPPLGPVHGGVGILEQLFHRFAVLRIDRNADTGSHEIAASIDLHRTVQRIADLARHHTDLTGVLDMIEHHHELVAPQPGHQILTPVAILQPLCDRFQHPVSGRMSQTIVDPFEIVQIDEQDPEAVFTSLRMGDSPLEMILQHAPVGQIGQCIVSGLIAEQCSGTAQVAHIAHGDHTTHHLAAVIVDGGGGTVDVEAVPVLGDDDGSLGKQRHRILAPQGGEQ